jgi:hypothetical protein
VLREEKKGKMRKRFKEMATGGDEECQPFANFLEHSREYNTFILFGNLLIL